MQSRDRVASFHSPHVLNAEHLNERGTLSVAMVDRLRHDGVGSWSGEELESLIKARLSSEHRHVDVDDD